MKKMILSASAAAFALIATNASAATIDINIGMADTMQVSTALVDQVAASGNISIGNVATSNIDSLAANINNQLEQNVDVSNLQATTYGGQLATSVVDQLSGPVNQMAISLNGQGGVSGSNLTSLAANVNNSATVRVNVH